MKNKLTLTEQEELFVKDCKLINLKYEYNGYTGAERWAIITELSVKELWEKYPLVIERYSPFVHLSIAQGEVIDDANRNEDKYAKRSSRTLDTYIPSEQVAIEVNSGSEDMEILKEHLCQQRGIKRIKLPMKSNETESAYAQRIKAAFQSVHIFITSDTEEDVGTIRNVYENWRNSQ